MKADKKIQHSITNRQWFFKIPSVHGLNIWYTKIIPTLSKMFPFC
jgi:hypothetical protein